MLLDLVSMPYEVHVVAGHQEGLHVLLLQLQVHLVPPHAVHMEVRVRVVRQRHLNRIQLHLVPPHLIEEDSLSTGCVECLPDRRRLSVYWLCKMST